MAVLVTAIHVLAKQEDEDARDKPVHDVSTNTGTGSWPQVDDSSTIFVSEFASCLPTNR